jgi:hypothetical protein
MIGNKLSRLFFVIGFGPEVFNLLPNSFGNSRSHAPCMAPARDNLIDEAYRDMKFSCDGTLADTSSQKKDFYLDMIHDKFL